jgi:hypothetical protein
MSSILSDPDQVRLIEKWRLRHAYPDAIGIWAEATLPEARAFAFNAIAQDPRVLHRAARLQAVRLATQAEEFARGLALTDAAKSDTWLAATLFVQRAIDRWRNSLKAYDRHTEPAAVLIGPASVGVRPSDPWETARRNFPHVDDDTGRLATRILREFGVSTLQRVRKPWDHVIALAVLRHAARLLRGEGSAADGFSRDDAITDILTVLEYAQKSGLSPMLVGYSGPGKPVQQALGLARDARTLRDAIPGERASGWQTAIDFHAFAVIALDHRILLNLPLDETYELAVAAIRQADRARQEPGMVAMPALPRTSSSAPAVVALHAKACLPSK